jgi:rhodanese-related sulfurtransferase
MGVAGLTLLYIGLKVWRRYELRRAPRIAAAEVVRNMEAGMPILFVDLRPLEQQREAPGIRGAVSMSLDDLARTATSLPRDRDIVFYCACPEDASSVQAVRLLREKGFTRVWPLAGGIEAWRTATVKNEEAIAAAQGYTVPA